jgi:hypothetical protein
MTHLCPTILDASLDQIAPLFLRGAKGDMQAARDAAQAQLDDYHPQTNQELILAADIVHYRLLAQDNLMRSTEADLSLTKILRLRGSAVSLSREANKAQRQLDKLQAARAEPQAEPRSAPKPRAEPEPGAEAATDQPPPTPAELAALHAARDILKRNKPSQYGGQSYAQQLSKRAMALVIKQNAARNAAQAKPVAA